MTQKPGGPIPLTIRLFGPPDIVVRGVIKAPQPEREFDKNFGMDTELYSGAPVFTIPIGIPGRAQAGTRVRPDVELRAWALEQTAARVNAPLWERLRELGVV